MDTAYLVFTFCSTQYIETIETPVLVVIICTSKDLRPNLKLTNVGIRLRNLGN